jgi:hypothetical protein
VFINPGGPPRSQVLTERSLALLTQVPHGDPHAVHLNAAAPMTLPTHLFRMNAPFGGTGSPPPRRFDYQVERVRLTWDSFFLPVMDRYSWLTV